MSKHRPLLLATAALGALAALGLLAWLLLHPGPRGGRAFLFPTGASKAYRFTLTTTITAGDGSAPQPVMVMALSGRLNLRVVEAGARSVLGVQLAPLSVRLLGEENPTMAGAFSRPFVVEIDRRGQLGATRFPADVPVPDRAVLDSAIRSLQVVLPPSPASTWQVTETDQNGVFRASYRAGDGGALDKRKTRYDVLRQPGVAAIRVVESRVVAEVDPAGLWLGRLEGSETLRFESTPGVALTTAAARFTLEPVAGPPDPSLAIFGDEPVRAIFTPVDSAGGDEDGAWNAAMLEEARRRFAAENVKIDDLLARLAAAGEGDLGANHELRAYLRAFPDATRGLAARLPSLPDTAASRLIAVLRHAGTPQAQGTLVEIVEGAGQSASNRTRALVALATVEHPTLEAIDRVARFRASGAGGAFGDTTVAALGAMAGRAPPDVKAGITAEITAELRTAEDPDAQRAALIALANAKADLDPEELGGFLGSDDPGVRAAAARAAGGSSRPEGTRALVDRLAAEQRSTVREAVLDGLLARPPDEAASAAVARALAEDREPAARQRQQMVTYLARAMARCPDNRAVLQAQLERETDRQVLVTILNALRR